MVKMGQSSPYPGADNTLSVTLELNVNLVPPGGYSMPNVGSFSAGDPVGISLVFSNILGASAAHHVAWLPPGSGLDYFGQNARCVNETGHSVRCLEVVQVSPAPQGGANFFKKVGKWDNTTKTLEIFVATQTPRDTQFVVKFQVVNNNTGQPSPNITVEVRVVEIPEISVQKDTNTNLASVGIYKAQPGDARPMLVFQPAFEIKSIGQTTPYPGAHNSLRLTLSFNVDVRARCDYHSAVHLNFSGFLGGECFAGAVPFSDPGGGGYGDSTQLLGALAANATDFSAGLVYWNGLHGLKRYSARLMRDIVAGRTFVVQLDLVNSATPQDSPDLTILTYGSCICACVSSFVCVRRVGFAQAKWCFL